jgi:hypothetical protein
MEGLETAMPREVYVSSLSPSLSLSLSPSLSLYLQAFLLLLFFK